jgi:single-stranded-DNA-specific exonuclease
MRDLRSITSYDGPVPSSLHSLHPVLQRIYAARQIGSLQELDYGIHRLLHFRDLKNIGAAAQLLADAISTDKKILIVGDFDTDGATSTALAMTALRQFGANHVTYLVPNRFEYGYGLSPEIVAIAKQPDIIITVDNGISSYQGVLAAQQAGIQVLITDHHLPPEILPPAEVIVNPQQPGDQFLSKNLAGVGVVFYVMVALRDVLQRSDWFQSRMIPYPKMNHLLDLVALGTVADMVPLDANNRILVHNGLQRIRSSKTCCLGIQALVNVSGCDLSQLTASHLGFNIAPKLNAAGRLQDMSLGIECLLAQDKQKALVIAKELSVLNKKRQTIEKNMQEKAFFSLNKLSLSSKQHSICLFDPKWHQGITGLVAGRIKERWNKPTIIFAPSHQPGELKGSARSILGIHIRDALANIAAQYPQLLSRFGGHAAAAGLSLAEEQYDQFSKIFESTIQELMCNLTTTEIEQTDGMLTAKELSVSFALLIQEAGPWGQGFPEPLFDGNFKLLSQRIVGERHLQMTLKYTESQKPIKGILFNVDLEQWPNFRVNTVRLLYRLSVDDWGGRREVKLHIQKLIC